MSGIATLHKRACEGSVWRSASVRLSVRGSISVGVGIRVSINERVRISFILRVRIGKTVATLHYGSMRRLEEGWGLRYNHIDTTACEGYGYLALG